MTFFLQNVVPFLNLGLAGFVLASVAARFIFPGVSLEGRTFWLLRSSPMSMRELLWSKFWVGTLPLLVLAIGIVGVTDVLLQVTAFMPSTIPIVKKNQDNSAQRRTTPNHSASSRFANNAAIANANGIAVAT